MTYEVHVYSGGADDHIRIIEAENPQQAKWYAWLETTRTVSFGDFVKNVIGVIPKNLKKVITK